MILYEGADRVRGRGRFVAMGREVRGREEGEEGGRMEKRDGMRENKEKWEKEKGGVRQWAGGGDAYTPCHPLFI